MDHVTNDHQKWDEKNQEHIDRIESAVSDMKDVAISFFRHLEYVALKHELDEQVVSDAIIGDWKDGLFDVDKKSIQMNSQTCKILGELNKELEGENER